MFDGALPGVSSGAVAGGVAGLLQRRARDVLFGPGSVERRRLAAVLDAGRTLPAGPFQSCRAVALEADEFRRDLVDSLRSAGLEAGMVTQLERAAILVALCDERGHHGGGPASWMAAAQMALAAEEEGLVATICAAPAATVAPACLSIGPEVRLEAILALGRAPLADGFSDPIPAPRGVDIYLGAASPPVPTPGADQGVLPSFMEIASATAQADDLEGLLEMIARALGRLFPVDGATLALLEGNDIVVREVLRRGGAVRRDPLRLPADASHLMGWVITGGKPLWRSDLSSELRFVGSSRGSGMRSDMTIPLRARGRITGAFRVACRRRHAFEEEDFEVLKRCADLTAVAVENQRLLLATRRLSEIDGLTGVGNHRHFQALLDGEVVRAGRTGQPLSLIMIDVDDFKRFNDTHGHPAGDLVLRHVAQTVAGLLRRSDGVARYGGEEFVALLPEAGLESARAVAETIRDEIHSTPIDLPSGERSLSVTISAGVASLPADGATGSALIEAADRGLYAAKRAGKNRVSHRP